MDEFNGFDPLNEYAPIEQEASNETPDRNENTSAPDFLNKSTNSVEYAEDTTATAQPENTQPEQQFSQQPFTQQGVATPPQQNAPVSPYPQYTQPQQPQYYQQGYSKAPYPAQQPPVAGQPYNQLYNRPYNQTYNQPVYGSAPVQNTGQYYTDNAYVQYTQNSNYNPYAQQAPNNAQKPKTPKSTKVLIGILIGLLVLFMLGFFVSCTALVFGNGTNSSTTDNPLSGYAEDPTTDPFYDEFYDYYSFNSNPSYGGDTFKEDITLETDDGKTQVKEGDKSSYPPDKDAKGIEFEKLPEDKDSKKYTTQSAFNAVCDSVVSILCYEDKITDDPLDIVSEGTGTIISKDGYIVTNSHVIGDTKVYTINVVLNNADEYTAQVVGYDARTDLAVLKIDAKNLSYAKFSDSAKVEVGQDIVAIGNPGGASFKNSLTKGIVSAVDRELLLSANVKYIQIDAAINPGNSGGPLCNIYGQVIGINTAKIASAEYEGMGFAIESEIVKNIANDLIKYGYVKDRVRLGLLGREVDDEMVYSYNVPYGVLITEIDEGGPLADTKVQEFDIITEIDGKKVTSFQEIYAVLDDHKDGDKITLTLYRIEY